MQTPLLTPMHRSELCVVPGKWASQIDVFGKLSTLLLGCELHIVYPATEVRVLFQNDQDQLDTPTLLQHDRKMLCYRSPDTLIQFLNVLKLCVGRMASMYGNTGTGRLSYT